MAIASDYSSGGYLKLLGGARPQIWATKALQALNNTSGDTSNNLSEARAWLTGEKQSRGAASELQAYKEQEAEIKKKVDLVNENYANITDFSNPNITEESKAKHMERAAKYLAENQDIFDQATTLGLPVNSNLVRTEAR